MILKIDKEASVEDHYSWYKWIPQFGSNSVVKCAFQDEQNGETVITHANELARCCHVISSLQFSWRLSKIPCRRLNYKCSLHAGVSI